MITTSNRKPAPWRASPWLCLGLALVVCASETGTCRGAALSPRLRVAARTEAERLELDRRAAHYARSQAGWVDRIYRQFSLSPAQFGTDGVAHRNILVVLCDFPSSATLGAVTHEAASTPAYYQRVFFSEDSEDGITSLREYYQDASRRRLDVSGRVVPEWVVLPQSADYYANGSYGLDLSYPRDARGMAEDAVRAALPKLDVPIGYFDNDGPDGIPSSGDDDGYIDAVCVIHARPGAEVLLSPNPNVHIWSHQAALPFASGCSPLESKPDCLPGLKIGDVRAYLYFTVGEYADYAGDYSVGTDCHEFGHVLGFPDLYDVDNSGVGVFSLMGVGNYLPLQGPGALGTRPGHLDPWCREYLGFEEPVVATTPGSYALDPVSAGGVALKIWTNGEPGLEHFLVEYRDRSGADQYLPGEGLLIYHIDDAKLDNGLYDPAGGDRVRVVEADGLDELINGYVYPHGDDGDYFPGSTGAVALTESTTPSSRAYGGADSGVRITGMSVGATATFDLVMSSAPLLRLKGLSLSDGSNTTPAPGEADSITVRVKNVGTATAPLAYTLTSLDPIVTILDGAASSAGLAPGGIADLSNAFYVQFDTTAVLPRDVAFSMQWSDGSANGSVPLVVTLGIGAGLAEGFENGLGAWTVEAIAPSASAQWHASTSRAAGGSSASAKIGSSLPLGSGSFESETYDSRQDAALVSPAFDLAPNSELVFDSYVDAEASGRDQAWDGGRVEISENEGPWLPLRLDGGFSHLIAFNSGASLRGEHVLSGSPQRWIVQVADLTPYSGRARIRFRFASDEANAPFDVFGTQLRYYEGWYVDNVLVRSRMNRVSRRLSLRAGPSPYWVGGPSSGTVTFRFSAPDGLPHPELRPMIRLFDVKGRLVQAFEARSYSLVPSEFRAEWDGTTRNGATARAGVYFASVDVAGARETVRLVLVR